jgi:LuxR family transcriptional regulator, activator of conjugal transfer of Ti plasmids
MHRIFQTFIDRLAASADEAGFRESMSTVAAALDLKCFAYLSLPLQSGHPPLLISTYPPQWTALYLQRHYERLDPVIMRALDYPEPFEWGPGVSSARMSKRQQALFAEAAQFGIRYGFTIPIHDGRGAIAAVTFAADERNPAFQRRVQQQARVLQLMAMYFHAHARRRLVGERVIDGVRLSPREFECLEWAAQGKSAWDIGQILGISRRTAAFHLDNVRTKLGVKSICQAVARLAASGR